MKHPATKTQRTTEKARELGSTLLRASVVLFFSRWAKA